MTDKEWYQLCESNWHKAAAELVVDGYTQIDRPDDRFLPAVFTKGNDRVYLARNLGEAEWYKSTLYMTEIGND